MKTKKSIEERIAAYLAHEASPEEVQEIASWIEESEENRQYYQHLRNIWQAAHPAFPPEEIDAEKARRSVVRQIDSRRSVISRWIGYWQRAAAVLLIPVLLAWGYMIYKDRALQTVTGMAYQEVFAPYGTHSKIDLPDGSTVWLNAGSSLKYPVAFQASERTVQLSGEAFFEVEADPQHPFIVRTNCLEVRAVGTAFHVEAYRKDAFQAVTMVKGKIDVTLGNAPSFSLKPGERLGYDRRESRCEVYRTDPYKWYAWKDGLLVFRNDPLEYVFKKIGQTFNVDIAVKDTTIANHLYRATFEDESLDEILRLLKMSAPIQYKQYTREKNAFDQYGKQRIEVYKSEK